MYNLCDNMSKNEILYLNKNWIGIVNLVFHEKLWLNGFFAVVFKFIFLNTFL